MATATPTRSSITEANKHLQALYKQVDTLNAAIHERNAMLELQELQWQQQVIDISSTNEKKVAELQNKLDESHTKNNQLHQTIVENKKTIEQLKQKEKILDDMTCFQPSLERLVAAMSHCSSPSSDSGVSFQESTPSAFKGDTHNVRRIAHHPHNQRRKKTFSISEDDEITDSEGETSEDKTKRKEVYF